MTLEPITPQPTCFVVIGFGRKTDYATGRVLDLDKTYEQLIRPAFDAVNVNCFRAIDANRTGGIDDIMYRWLFDADIVVADLSTLNANVFYELGVRHAQKPNTTIIIAESVLMEKIPFDLSHFVIHQYRHGGDDIAESDQKEFVTHLSGVVRDILAAEEQRRKVAPDKPRLHDSPVYSVLQGMTPPAYTPPNHLAAPTYTRPEDRAVPVKEEGETLASIIDAAEKAKSGYTIGEGAEAKKVPVNYPEAIKLFQQAIDRVENAKKKPDLFLTQRLALVTYKHAEKLLNKQEIDPAEAERRMLGAESILERYCAPEISTDPETLGLSGAIKKRLFELTKRGTYLDDAIRFYERGFYVRQDYYNGINVAFMYTQRAIILLGEDKQFDAIVSYGYANIIREKVAAICAALRKDQEGFARRGDRVWLLMSEAEAYRGLGEQDKLRDLEAKIDSVPPKDFERNSYQKQQKALTDLMEQFTKSVQRKPESASRDQSKLVPAKLSSPRINDAGAILVDANLDPGRSIKSIEVHCKIEYLD